VGYVCISRPRRILGTVAHNEDRERSTHWPPDKGFLQLTRLIAGLRPRPSLAINPRPSPVTSVACSNIPNSPRAAGDTSAPEIIVLGTRGMAHCHRKSVPLSLSLSLFRNRFRHFGETTFVLLSKASAPWCRVVLAEISRGVREKHNR
jgi:hypothetical protein